MSKTRKADPAGNPLPLDPNETRQYLDEQARERERVMLQRSGHMANLANLAEAPTMEAPHVAQIRAIAKKWHEEQRPDKTGVYLTYAEMGALCRTLGFE